MINDEKLKSFKDKKNYIDINISNGMINCIDNNITILKNHLNQGITFILNDNNSILNLNNLTVKVNVEYTYETNKIYYKEIIDLDLFYTDENLYFFYWKINPLYLDRLYTINLWLSISDSVNLINTNIFSFNIKYNLLDKLDLNEIKKYKNNKKILNLLAESKKDLKEIKNRIEMNDKKIIDIEGKIDKSIKISESILEKYNELEKNYTEIQKIHEDINKKVNEFNNDIIPEINKKVNYIDNLVNNKGNNITYYKI